MQMFTRNRAGVPLYAHTEIHIENKLIRCVWCILITIHHATSVHYWIRRVNSWLFIFRYHDIKIIRLKSILKSSVSALSPAYFGHIWSYWFFFLCLCPAFVPHASPWTCAKSTIIIIKYRYCNPQIVLYPTKIPAHLCKSDEQLCEHVPKIVNISTAPGCQFNEPSDRPAAIHLRNGIVRISIQWTLGKCMSILWYNAWLDGKRRFFLFLSPWQWFMIAIWSTYRARDDCEPLWNRYLMFSYYYFGPHTANKKIFRSKNNNNNNGSIEHSMHSLQKAIGFYWCDVTRFRSTFFASLHQFSLLLLSNTMCSFSFFAF